MGIEFLASLIGALASLAAGGLVVNETVRELVLTLLKKKAPPKPYSERLHELTDSLTRASREVDALLVELSRVADDRQKAVTVLEADLSTLEGREQELKEKIQILEKVPLPVAEHFAQLLEVGEKRSARRDYLLFGSGVVVTTLLAVIIQVLSG